MRNGLKLIPVVLAVAAAFPVSNAKAQSREMETVVRSNMVVDEIIDSTKKGLPAHQLRNAYAVAIFPNIVKGGFVVGGRYGHGLVMIRNGNEWSFPIFASLAGGSFGFQAGIQQTDLVLVFKSRQSLDSFFSGEDKLTIGADGSLALGGLGRHAEAGTGVALKAQYVAYSRNRGLFAGASLAGTALSIDWRSNNFFYGRAVSPGEIITKQRLTIPKDSLASVVSLQNTMARKTRLGSEVKAVEIGPDGSETDFGAEEPVIMDSRRAKRSSGSTTKSSSSTPKGDGPDLLPIPPDTGSPVAPRTTTSTPKSKSTSKPKPANPDADLDEEPPSTRRRTPPLMPPNREP